MAPTRRSRKRESRMDAAIDAMSPYGFPKKLIRQTAYQLLKVYGGSDGWVFIEDSGYTLLIDTLLEKQANASTPASPRDGLLEDNLEDGHNEASPAGCSNRALIPCSNTETFDDSSLTNHAIDTVSAASETGNQLPIKAVNTVSATCETEIFAVPVGEIHGTPLLACPTPIETKPPQPVKMLCHKTRRPCLGWISDDDEEEEPIVELSPAPLCLT